MKFGQLMEYNDRNVFFQKTDEAGRLVPDLFCFLKALRQGYTVKFFFQSIS